MAVTFDAAGPSSSGYYSAAPPSPVTFAHVNGGNGILVAVTSVTGSSDLTTAVSYGGVALAFLGYQESDGASGGGGVSYWGKIGGLPSGSNTVSVSSGSSTICAGSVSLAGAGSFGTVFKAFGSTGGGTVSVTGTVTGGLIVAAECNGGTGLTWAASSGGTLRINDLGDGGGAANNLGMSTTPSPGGTQAVGFTTGSDWWGLLAVEIIPAPTGPSVTTTTLPGGTYGAPYSQTLAATGGTTPYTWSVASGSLPAGLSLSSGGVISGTPAAAGASSFTVQVTDAASASGTQALTLTIAPLTSGPAPPAAGAGLAGGTGTWTSPGSITADDGTAATWAVV